MTDNTYDASFVESLFQNLTAHKKVFSFYYYNTDLSKYNQPQELLKILSLPDNYLQGDANKVYEFLEKNKDIEKETLKL